MSTNGNGKVHLPLTEPTTDPVEYRSWEFRAVRRMREYLALLDRQKRERAIEKAGGPKVSQW